MSLIRLFPHPDLQTYCPEVTDFGPSLMEDIQLLIRGMEEARTPGKNVHAIAANQVGVLKRIIIAPINGTQKVLINPVITKRYYLKKFCKKEYMIDPSPEELAAPLSERSWIDNTIKEGCLSTPGLYAVVPSRAHSVWVSYKTPSGEYANAELEGIEAVCVQHEIDHLDGIVWFSKLSKTQKNKFRKTNKRWTKNPIWRS